MDHYTFFHYTIQGPRSKITRVDSFHPHNLIFPFPLRSDHERFTLLKQKQHAKNRTNTNIN